MYIRPTSLHSGLTEPRGAPVSLGSPSTVAATGSCDTGGAWGHASAKSCVHGVTSEQRSRKQSPLIHRSPVGVSKPVRRPKHAPMTRRPRLVGTHRPLRKNNELSALPGQSRPTQSRGISRRAAFRLATRARADRSQRGPLQRCSLRQTCLQHRQPLDLKAFSGVRRVARISYRSTLVKLLSAAFLLSVALLLLTMLGAS